MNSKSTVSFMDLQRKHKDKVRRKRKNELCKKIIRMIVLSLCFMKNVRRRCCRGRGGGDDGAMVQWFTSLSRDIKFRFTNTTALTLHHYEC